MILSATDRDRPARVRGGFTLVELLVVIVILAVLIGLLLPAINGALRTARKAAVSSEINQLASALASFKSKYGDYPPSRFLAVENGHYETYLGDSTNLQTGTLHDPTSPGTNDISVGQLAQRSVSAIRKFWPRVSTTGTPQGQWYDFNGNGVLDQQPYILHGHECLVFFLGGIPSQDSTGNFGMSGFDKSPTNPFTNNLNNSNAMYGPNRQSPLFEFVPSRLFADPNSLTGIPGYIDSIGKAPPSTTGPNILGLNFYAYFSAYGNGGYDPNDVNFNEYDANQQLSQPAMELGFSVAFPTYVNGSRTSNVAYSSSPNPYTSTLTIAEHTNGTSVVTYLNAQSFQIISSGIDGFYGVGGQYSATSSASATSTNPLPLDTITSPAPYLNTINPVTQSIPEPTIRQREQDNLTNFKASSLQ